MASNDNTNRTLFIALSGIGNLLMQLPAIRAYKQRHPEAHITVWVAPRGTKALAENEDAIDEVIEMPIKASPVKHAQQILKLRSHKFNTGIVLYPGQHLKSAAYMFLAGIKERIGHEYPFRSTPTSSFLLTKSIPKESNIHDAQQNLNLIGSNFKLGIDHWSFEIPALQQHKASQIIGNLNNQTLIGFHMGSAPNMPFKRWPIKNFVELAKLLSQKIPSAHFLLFGAHDESVIKEKFISLSHDDILSTSISTDLITTSAIMKRCRFVISNDSGLMHLAAASGTKVYGLFGPTDETRTGPMGEQSQTIRAPATQPVFDVDLNFDLGSEPHETILALKPAYVAQAILP